MMGGVWLRPFLEAAWDKAPDGTEYVIPEEYRKRAQGPAGWANANLRTTLEKIIRRAGLEPWPRLWHSMGASCETDLARKFPLAVVAKWLGNTQALAMRHYVDVTDADFERATAAHPPEGGAKGGAHVAQTVAPHANAPETNAHEKTPVASGVTHDDSQECAAVNIWQVPRVGLEPTTY